MPAERQIPPQRWALGAVFALGAGLALAAGGCATSTGAEGSQRETEATYSWGTLSCELSERIRVPAVAAAIDVVLRERGYSVVDDQRGEDNAVLRGRKLGGDWDPDKVTVRTRVEKATTSLSVRVEPFGDEVISRAIMDAILVRLGR